VKPLAIDVKQSFTGGMLQLMLADKGKLECQQSMLVLPMAGAPDFSKGDATSS
jgi:hypothetical protein